MKGKVDKDQEEQEIFPEGERQQKQEEQSLAITYGQVPVSMKCPYCLQHIHSEIILKPEFISMALGFSIFAIVPNFLMTMLLVLLLQVTASRKHRCPLCERQLGSDGKFLLYFTDQVISFSLFSAGFIFTKKMLFTAGLLSFTFIVLSLRYAKIDSQKWVATTWPEYLQDCRQGNPTLCLLKYRNKQFKNWEGHVMRIVDNRESDSKWYLHALSLFMKMDPAINTENAPDILLTLNSDAVFLNSQSLRRLQHGDLIQFNCTLHQRQRGTFKDVMHFHVDTLNITGHDPKFGLYTTQIEQEWILVHVENRGKLQSEGHNLEDIKPI